jgi:hypothetical protein
MDIAARNDNPAKNGFMGIPSLLHGLAEMFNAVQCLRTFLRDMGGGFECTMKPRREWSPRRTNLGVVRAPGIRID